MFLINVENYSQTTLFQYTMTDLFSQIMNQYLDLFNLVDMVYSQNAIECNQYGCQKISSEISRRTPIAVQQGGDEARYNNLKEILEKYNMANCNGTRIPGEAGRYYTKINNDNELIGLYDINTILEIPDNTNDFHFLKERNSNGKKFHDLKTYLYDGIMKLVGF